MKKSYLSIAASAVLLAFVGTGCSSGSDSTAPVTPEATYTGIFVDAGAAGLSYACTNGVGVAITGLTDADGKFSGCGVSSTVKFSLGNLDLGSMPYPTNGVFTPTLLAEASGGTAEEKQVIANNIASTLLSIDADGNPDNGIQITEANVATFNTTVPAGSAITNPTVAATVAATTQAMAEAPGSTLVAVTPADAQTHLEIIAEAINAGDFDQPAPVEPAVVTGS